MAWRDGSGLKSTSCSSRVAGFSSRHLHGSSQPSVTLVSGTWHPLLISVGTRQMMHIHKCRKNMNTHKENKSFFKINVDWKQRKGTWSLRLKTLLVLALHFWNSLMASFYSLYDMDPGYFIWQAGVAIYWDKIHLEDSLSVWSISWFLKIFA